MLLVAIACGSASRKSGADIGGFPGDDEAAGDGLPDARPPDQVSDGGSFSPGNRPNDGGDAPEGGRGQGDAPPAADTGGSAGGDSATIEAGGYDASTVDAGDAPSDNDGSVAPQDACSGPLAKGDLAIVELMIATTANAGDKGEWLEVQSTRPCSLNLRGLHAASGSVALDVASDLWLPPNGILVIADSSDSSINHALPGPLLVWGGSPADVLPNGGGEIVLSSGSTVVDDLTYPAFVLYACESISFPADCAWSDRASWMRWSYSSHSWVGGCAGTPNADNTDVACY